MVDIKNNKPILKLYEDITYTIFSDTTSMDIDKEAYLNIKKYFDKSITFEQLMEVVDGSCPPNSCYWCEDNCDLCDIKANDSGKCNECWKRCLEQE